MNPPVSVLGPTGRNHALDALRTLAVLGMMAAHTARLIPFDIRPEWARGVLLYEPIIPSLFLLLVGLSLSQSFDAAQRAGRSSRDWFLRQLKRAGMLWVISAVFFTLELGPRLPDALLAGGILANIAYAIILTSGLLALPPPFARPALTAALVAGTTLFVILDTQGHRIYPLNIGNSPFFPLWLFAFAGAVWGQFLGQSGNRTSNRILVSLAGLGAAALAIALIVRYGGDAIFTKPLGRSDAARLVPAPFTGGEAINLGYYNLRPLLAATCLGLQIAALVFLGLVLARLKEGAARWVFAIGRHSLLIYVVHLSLLAVLVVVSGTRQPLQSAQSGLLVLLALILICQSIAIFRGKPKIVLIKH